MSPNLTTMVGTHVLYQRRLGLMLIGTKKSSIILLYNAPDKAARRVQRPTAVGEKNPTKPLQNYHAQKRLHKPPRPTNAHTPTTNNS